MFDTDGDTHPAGMVPHAEITPYICAVDANSFNELAAFCRQAVAEFTATN